MGGFAEWVDGWIPIYILPASGRWSHSLPRLLLLPASGRGFAFAKQGNKMRRLRRRNHELGGGMVGGIANDMYNNDVGKGVVYAYEAYEAK